LFVTDIDLLGWKGLEALRALGLHVPAVAVIQLGVVNP
jgi:hypothetical protein